MIAKSSRAKTIFAKLILIAISVFIGLLIAEVALRVVGYSDPQFYIVDQARGYALRPNAAGWYRKEGEAYIQINSDGLRDREHSFAKPENTVRIAVLGDSYPEALQVSLEESFWWVMGQKLRECEAFQGRNVEVINFGVSGYGTAQELLTLRERVWKYSPDIVMLTVTTNNDVTDNSRTLKKTDEVPYFLVQNGNLQLDNSFQTSRAFVWRQSKISRFGRWLRASFRVVQAAVQGHRSLKVLISSARSDPETQTTPADQDAVRREVFAKSEELGIDNLIYLEPPDPVWQHAWSVTEKLIVQMRDEVKARGAGFWVVTLSNGPQVLPDPMWREAFMKRFAVNDIFYPDRRIQSLGQRQGFPVITLAPALQEYAQSNKVFLHGTGKDAGNGHWNPIGHRVAGEILAKQFCQEALHK